LEGQFREPQLGGVQLDEFGARTLPRPS